MSGGVAVAVEGPVATLTLDRPEVLNALSVELLGQLVDACEDLRSREDVRVVVLRGAGRVFSAGADLGTVALLVQDGPEARAAADAGDRAASALEALPQVTVAAIHGRCVGGGVVLAAACDLRVAAADTVFSIPEVDLGIPLAWGGIPRLLREIPPAVARDLVLTCREFGADEALTHGLVSRVVAPDQLDTEVAALADGLARKARLPVRATLDAVAARLGAGAPVGWSDADALLSAMRDPESRAAGQAYVAKVLGTASDPSTTPDAAPGDTPGDGPHP
jgi:enoyl-CoA hydratase/carnithine racemase